MAILKCIIHTYGWVNLTFFGAKLRQDSFVKANFPHSYVAFTSSQIDLILANLAE